MPEEGSGVEGNQAAAGEKEIDGVKMVPLTALTGARDEMKTVKEEAQVLQDQNDLYRANMANVATEGTEAKTEVIDPFKELKDDDVVTVADVKRVMGTQNEKWGAIAEQLKVGQGDPKYLGTIEKYLPAELAKDPDLAAAIKTSKNPALLALKIAKGSEAYTKDQQDATLAAAAEGESTVDAAGTIIANQLRPGATSTGAGAGGGVNSVEFYKAMSEDDVEARIQKIQGNA